MNPRILICKPGPARSLIRKDKLISAEPLEIEYLYTVLKGYDVSILAGVRPGGKFIKAVRAKDPDVVLFTSVVTQVDMVLRMSSQLKQLDTPPLVFVGGPHAEVFPEHFYSEGIDGVFYSNSLEGITAVMERISSGRAHHDISGAAFRINGRFIKNSSPPQDPSKLPIPDRIILKKSADKFRYLYYHPCASVKTALGCTENCIFCFCSRMNSGNYSPRPMNDVIEEIRGIDLKNIIIIDDNFLTGRERLLEFCRLVKEKNIEKNFVSYGNANFVSRNPDVMRELREAGLTGLIVGFEFVSDSELREFGKNATMEDNKETLEICRDLGIEVFALFIVNPDWRFADFRKLSSFLRENDISFATFSTITPFPGTALSARMGVSFDNNTRWWRYDLLRLHQEPKHMSRLMYYIWIYYLYILPATRPKALRKLRHYYGTKEIIRLLLAGPSSAFDFFGKLLLWK